MGDIRRGRSRQLQNPPRSVPWTPADFSAASSLASVHTQPIPRSSSRRCSADTLLVFFGSRIWNACRRCSTGEHKEKRKAWGKNKRQHQRAWSHVSLETPPYLPSWETARRETAPSVHTTKTRLTRRVNSANNLLAPPTAPPTSTVDWLPSGCACARNGCLSSCCMVGRFSGSFWKICLSMSRSSCKQTIPMPTPYSGELNAHAAQRLRSLGAPAKCPLAAGARRLQRCGRAPSWHVGHGTAASRSAAQ